MNTELVIQLLALVVTIATLIVVVSYNRKTMKKQYMDTIYNIIATRAELINTYSNGALSNPQLKDFSNLVSHIITTKQVIKSIIDYSNGMITESDTKYIIEHYRLSLHIDILNMIDTLHQNSASAFGVNATQPQPNKHDHIILAQQQQDVINLFKLHIL